MPQHWQEQPVEATDIPYRWQRAFTPPGLKEVEISLFFRGRKLDATAAAAFKKVLRQPSHPLKEQEFLDLSRVMLNMGDNQYIDPDLRGSQPPNCVIQMAETGSINGKSVLVVQGTFQDSKGKPVNECCNVFIDGEGSGQYVFEIYLVVPAQLGPSIFQQQLGLFRGSIATIEWADTLILPPLINFGI